jgi:Arm DNA-binding domain
MNYSLTITQLKTAKASADGKPFKLRDGGGLFVFVSATGAKSWRYKYRILGKESVYTMGTFPDLGIADARVMHAKARELVNQGVHPKAQRDADRNITMLIAGDTFKAVADHWFEERKPKWTAYYASQIETSMKADVYPVIGGLPIRKVTSAQILQILKAVEKRGAPVVAMNIRQWCSQVFKYAIVNLKAENDPTSVLQGVVVRPKIKHNVPLTPDQITGLLKEMAKFGGYRTTAIAIELLLLRVSVLQYMKSRWIAYEFKGKVSVSLFDSATVLFGEYSFANALQSKRTKRLELAIDYFGLHSTEYISHYHGIKNSRVDSNDLENGFTQYSGSRYGRTQLPSVYGLGGRAACMCFR